MTKREHNIPWERTVRRLSYQDLMETMRVPGATDQGPRDRQYFSQLLELLERFLDELVTDTAIPFIPQDSTNRGIAYQVTSLAERYFNKVPEFLQVVEELPPQNWYSEHIEAFIACCTEMGLVGHKLEWNDLWEAPRQSDPRFGGVSAAELFNMLVAKLREICLTERTKERARRRRSEADGYAKDYENYAEVLRGMTTRLVVLRIDLEYRKEFKDQISVGEALADLDHFFSNQRNNSRFKGKLGFICKLEYGVLKSLHFHLILFFDGAIKDGRTDVYLAKKIGEYWVEVITKGRGNYWNVNAKKQQYKQKGILGIGLIHDDEYGDALFKNLKHRIICYMCKSTQFVRAKLPEELRSRGRSKHRLFRRGNYPKEARRKPGRPPKVP